MSVSMKHEYNKHPEACSDAWAARHFHHKKGPPCLAVHSVGREELREMSKRHGHETEGESAWPPEQWPVHHCCSNSRQLPRKAPESTFSRRLICECKQWLWRGTRGLVPEHL